MATFFLIVKFTVRGAGLVWKRDPPSNTAEFASLSLAGAVAPDSAIGWVSLF